jgi:SAM-dependent methyltransferase
MSVFVLVHGAWHGSWRMSIVLLLLLPLCGRGQTTTPLHPGTKPAPGSKEQWNENFRDPAIRRLEPDDLLVKAIQDRKPGSALDLGTGQGRNSLYLAEKGWRTTGVDFSEVAIADAQAEALKRGLSVKYVMADLAGYDLGQEKWDLILYSYMQSWLKSAPLDHAKRVRTALKPGGILIIEGFAGKEAPTAVAFDGNELLRTFADLRVLFYEDTAAVPKWGRQRVSRRVIRFIAT